MTHTTGLGVGSVASRHPAVIGGEGRGVPRAGFWAWLGVPRPTNLSFLSPACCLLLICLILGLSSAFLGISSCVRPESPPRGSNLPAPPSSISPGFLLYGLRSLLSLPSGGKYFLLDFDPEQHSPPEPDRLIQLAENGLRSTSVGCLHHLALVRAIRSTLHQREFSRAPLTFLSSNQPEQVGRLLGDLPHIPCSRIPHRPRLAGSHAPHSCWRMTPFPKAR